jgi:hypothetical protein
VSVETLRYCDLCGATIVGESAKLAVPLKRLTSAQREQLEVYQGAMHPSAQPPQMVRWYDVCDPCLEPMLVNVRAHEARAREELERRRREQLLADGTYFIGGGPLIVGGR